VFAWLGEAEPSAFPHFDCFTAPDAYTFAFKGYWDCNWLQALEVGIDPAHASYLHRYFEDEDTATSYGKQFRGKPSDSELPISKVLREFDRPDISVERTDYGIRLVTLRKIDERQTHGRSTHILFPADVRDPDERRDDDHAVARAGRRLRLLLVFDLHQLHDAGRQEDDARAAPQGLSRAGLQADLQSRRTAGASMPTSNGQSTFTGMGFDINIHDQFACESPGRIADRTKEHLGTTDKGIVLYRRMLVEAIEKHSRGEKTLMMLSEAEARSAHRPSGDRRHRRNRKLGRLLQAGGRRATQPRAVVRRRPHEARLASGFRYPEGDREPRHRGRALRVRRPARHPARQDDRRRPRWARRSRTASGSRARCC
jgi:hypothetical protein